MDHSLDAGKSKKEDYIDFHRCAKRAEYIVVQSPGGFRSVYAASTKGDGLDI